MITIRADNPSFHTQALVGQCQYVCVLIGGVIVFAATSVIYLNQSVPPYAASLSSLSTVATQFPMSKSIYLTFYITPYIQVVVQ